jgi:ribosomal protein L21
LCFALAMVRVERGREVCCGVGMLKGALGMVICATMARSRGTKVVRARMARRERERRSSGRRKGELPVNCPLGATVAARLD